MNDKPSKIELKPCPFCGMEPDIYDYGDADDAHWIVECKSGECRLLVSTHACGAAESAAAVWNKRFDVGT